jgi:glutamate/tyrosine decarboxylase-like PLP-dependent enzyme
MPEQEAEAPDDAARALDPSEMFLPVPGDAAAAHAVADWALARLAGRRDILPRTEPDGPLPALGRTGIGADAALEVFRKRVAPTAMPPDHPRFLAFIPGAPTVAAALTDMALSVAMIYGGDYLEGGRAVEAEEAAVRWLADAAGFPATAGGTFVSGGSIANLSALVAARGGGPEAHRRRVIVAGASAHSSMAAAAHIMGCELVTAPAADAHGRLDARTLEQALEPLDTTVVVAVVATAGATNTGAFDDLGGVADVCAAHDLRLHVDGAYGGAALLSPRTRPLLDGIERADSFIVDPHKMLYSTFDCAALVYRDCAAASAALTQTADYLEAVCDGEAPNPSDLAIHLTRRARGVPLWASVLAYGTDAYAAAVDHCVDITAYAAERIQASPVLEAALEPAFSVILVRRPGWSAEDYAAWCDQAMARGVAAVLPTKLAGEPLLRFCFVNPLTTREDVDLVLADLS